MCDQNLYNRPSYVTWLLPWNSQRWIFPGSLVKNLKTISVIITDAFYRQQYLVPRKYTGVDHEDDVHIFPQLN